MRQKLDIDGAHEVVACLTLDLPLERYRERLAPLAEAILAGASRSTVDAGMQRVLAGVWDSTLRVAVEESLVRLCRLVDGALDELTREGMNGPFACAVVDRIMYELLEAHDKNIDALRQLEEELRMAHPDERSERASPALRGAASDALIPMNEIRLALVRVARRGLGRPNAADQAAREFARMLATDARRASARNWVSRMADGMERQLPLLAAELHRFAEVAPPHDPGADVVWVQACVGIAFEQGSRLTS